MKHIRVFTGDPDVADHYDLMETLWAIGVVFLFGSFALALLAAAVCEALGISPDR